MKHRMAVLYGAVAWMAHGCSPSAATAPGASTRYRSAIAHAPDPRLRLRGTVEDEAGKPIANATPLRARLSR